MRSDKYRRKPATRQIRNKVLIVCCGKTEKDFNEVWAVFDKDNSTDFDSAIALAHENEINCAFTNKAIEYWFLLHLEDRHGALSNNKLKELIERCLGFEYKKDGSTCERVFKSISSKTVEAENRARLGHERHKTNSDPHPSQWCSCTTVYKLTKRLREWSQAN